MPHGRRVEISLDPAKRAGRLPNGMKMVPEVALPRASTTMEEGHQKGRGHMARKSHTRADLTIHVKKTHVAKIVAPKTRIRCKSSRAVSQTIGANESKAFSRGKYRHRPSQANFVAPKVPP